MFVWGWKADPTSWSALCIADTLFNGFTLSSVGEIRRSRVVGFTEWGAVGVGQLLRLTDTVTVHNYDQIEKPR